MKALEESIKEDTTDVNEKKPDYEFFENRERIIHIQNEISSAINHHLELYKKPILNEDPHIHLDNAIKLSVIYKNIGG